MGASDLGDAKERRRGLDHGDEPRRAENHAALGLDLVDDLGQQSHMLGAVDLGKGQRRYARADRRLDVPNREPQWPVDPHHDISPTARHNLSGFGHQPARPLLFRGGNAIFEIEDDRVGAAARRTIDKAPLGDGDEQQRPPYREIVVHAAPPPSRTMPSRAKPSICPRPSPSPVRISAVCSPNSGAGSRRCPGARQPRNPRDKPRHIDDAHPVKRARRLRRKGLLRHTHRRDQSC